MTRRPPPPFRPPTLGLGLAALLFAALFAGPAVAQSQSDKKAPLELTFVDATPDTSGAIHDKLREIISQSEDISFADPEKFLFSAGEFDVTLDVLASERKRRARTEPIRRALRANELEALIVYERVDERLHLIVIGPNGTQLKHFEAPIKRSQITDEQAVKVLKQLFEVLVPEVRAFRRREARGEGPETKARAEEREGPETDAVDRRTEGDSDAAEASGGRFDGNVTVSLSPVVGRRSLEMNSAAQQNVLSHRTGFIGVGGRVTSTFGVLSSNRAALGATAFFQFSRFPTRFQGVEETVQGSFFRAGGTFRYIRGLSENLALFGGLGIQGVDVGLEENEVYVGSSYVSLVVGPGLLYRIAEIGRFELGARLTPSLSTSTNQDAFGDGSTSLGFNAEARFTVDSFAPVLLSAYYVFDLYRPSHQSPSEFEGPADGTDFINIGGLSVGYRF